VIRVVVGDLASFPTDALVRPASTALAPASRALLAAEAVAGATFRAQFASASSQPVGSAFVTGGGPLSAPFVVHAIIKEPQEPPSADGVRRAFASVLHRAREWRFARLCTPPLGWEPDDGTGEGLVMETTATIMLDVLHHHLKENTFPSDVSIVVEREEHRALFDTLMEQMTG
jgi:O-acetyl-ADP-ribose deacetylase (regulator of RNase III)